MFVSVDLKTIFYKEFVHAVTICHQTNFHMPNPCGSWGTATKLKTEHIFYTTIMLLLYIL